MWCRQFSLLVVLIVAGCGGSKPATYPVAGRVTFPDGKPLHGGVVEMQPMDHPDLRISARGQIQPDGTFQMSTFARDDGVVAGKHRALIIPPLPPGRIDPTKLPDPVIHPRFQRYETSGLEVTVMPNSDNTVEITVDAP